MTSTAHLVGGVLGLNAIVLVVGYALLAPTLRGRSLGSWLTYAGLALLTGLMGIGVTMTLLAVLDARAGVAELVLVAAALVLAGSSAAWRIPQPWRARIAAPEAVPSPPRSRLSDIVATSACFGVAAVCAFGVVGGFRSSAWLDDVWYFWLPRGVAIDQVGLDPRLFAPSDVYFGFANPYYPLLWSLVANLDVAFAGAFDLRAVNAQLAIVVVAFVAATARLLWGRVRPAILWPCLLLLVSSPALFRQAQAGGADLPLAFYLVLAVLAAIGWIVYRLPFALIVLFVGAAGALALKREGLPQLLVFLVVLSLAALPGRRRALVGLWLTVAAAFLTSVPWLLWQATHEGLRDRITAAVADPSRTVDRGEQAERALEQLVTWSTRPQEWLVVLPVFFGLALVGLIRERRLHWLVPPGLVLAGYLFWVWFFVTDPYNTVASFPIAYRVVDALLVLSAVLVPLLAERLLRR